MYVEFYSDPHALDGEEAVIGDALGLRDREESGREERLDAAAPRNDQAGRIPYEDIN